MRTLSVGDRLAELRCAWQHDIRMVPMSTLIGPASAAELIRYVNWERRVRASPDETRTRPWDQ